MDMIAISLGVVVAGAVVAYLTRPWWAMLKETPSDGVDPAGLEKALSERHEAILSALRDLDFDHEVGKVTEEDYSSLRQTWLAEAATTLAQLDEVQVVRANLDEQIEAQILAVRRTLQTEQQPEVGRQAPLPGHACLTCGRPAHPGDLYCAGCGTRLVPACPTCGEVVQPSDFYCTSCGIELALTLAG